MKKRLFILICFFIVFAYCSYAGFFTGIFRSMKPYTCTYLGDGLYRCLMDSDIVVENANPCSSIRIGINATKNTAPMVEFYINQMSINKEAKTFAKILNSIQNGSRKEQVFKILLDNDEILICRGFLFDRRQDEYRGSLYAGAGQLCVFLNDIRSNKASLDNYSVDKKVLYVSKQLSEYSIKKIIFEGVTFSLERWSTYYTLRCMFNTLYKKTGNEAIYH